MAASDAMTYWMRYESLRCEAFSAAAPNWENSSTGWTWASPTHWYVSLLTAAPGEGVTDQTVNEANLAVLGRAAMLRGVGGITLNQVDPANPFYSNAAALVFGKNTTGSDITVSHVGIGTAATGTGRLMRVVPFAGPIDIPPNAVFAIGAGQLQVFKR